MKISILQGAFLPVPGARGGAIEKAWFELGKEFARQGHEVTHVSRLCDGLPAREWIEKVRHLRIEGSDAVASSLLLKFLELPFVWRARRVLPRADVLVTNAFWAPILLGSGKFGKTYVHVGRAPKGQMKLYRRAGRFQAPTEAVAKAITAEIPKRSDLVSVIPYPLPWKVEAMRSFGNRPKRILYFGRIHPEKGVLELAKAWNRLGSTQRQDWGLRIVGPWKPAQGGGGAEYLGKIQEEERKSRGSMQLGEPLFEEDKIKEEYANGRIFAYPSQAEKGETFGLAVLEAMSFGCVPLVSGLACFQDFVSSDFGFVVNSNNGDFQEELGDCLAAAIEDQASHESRAAAAYRRCADFEVEKVARRFLEDFERT